jgi:hypothetical protein
MRLVDLILTNFGKFWQMFYSDNFLCHAAFKNLFYQACEKKSSRLQFVRFVSRAEHRNLKTRRRRSSQKWTLSLLKQGKLKVGEVPADG